MIVWTIQPYSALDQLRESGVFRCAPEKSFNLTKPNSLKGPYAWLAAQMEKRIGPPPDGVAYPIWAWHTWDFQRRCPDPDSAAFLKRREAKGLFTLDVPEGALVLSDFDAWQGVMLGTHVPNVRTEADYVELAARLDGLEGEALRAEIVRSWENVFRIDPVNSDFLVRGRFIQATFWELRAESVRDVRRLPPNLE